MFGQLIKEPLMKKSIIILITLLAFAGEGWAGNIVNKWQEYRGGKLTAPAVVQVDQCGKEYLIWVWDGASIQGPFSRTTYNEAEIKSTAMVIKAQEPTVQVEPENSEITALKAEVATLKAENATLTAEKTALEKQITEAPTKGVTK